MFRLSTMPSRCTHRPASPAVPAMQRALGGGTFTGEANDSARALA